MTVCCVSLKPPPQPLTLIWILLVFCLHWWKSPRLRLPTGGTVKLVVPQKKNIIRPWCLLQLILAAFPSTHSSVAGFFSCQALAHGGKWWVSVNKWIKEYGLELLQIMITFVVNWRYMNTMTWKLTHWSSSGLCDTVAFIVIGLWYLTNQTELLVDIQIMI